MYESHSLDLFSPAVQQNPYPFYGDLRRNSPVHYFAERDLWAVSRYTDVVSILKNPTLFSSGGMVVFGTVLVGADPPSHTQIRRLLSGAFSRPRTALLEDRIRTLTYQLIDEILARGKCDLMADFACLLPLLVMTEILGIDPTRCADYKRWADAAVSGDTRSLNDIEKQHIVRSLEEFQIFFEDYVDRCSQQPGLGLLSELLQGPSAAERFTPEQAVDIGKLLLIAGCETTTNLIGNAVLTLLRNPQDMAFVCLHPQCIPEAIEEVLRYESPVQIVPRRTTKDVDISGVRMPAGASVVALLGSANRDPQHFDDPERFCITRQARDHLAFSAGPHYCLGASLAQLEARIALEALISRLPGLRPGQPLHRIEFLDSTFNRGPKRLELQFDVYV